MIIYLYSRLNASNLYHEDVCRKRISSDGPIYFLFDVTPLDSIYKLKE